MRIDLAGKRALVCGGDGPIAASLTAALRENGATVVCGSLEALPSDAGEPFLLVTISAGAEALPQEDGAGAEAEVLAALTRRLAPKLGRVVNVFSAAGLVPVKGLARFSAGQAGVASLTRTLAMELGPDIRVNGVAVGAYAQDDGTVSGSRFLSHTALRRPATLAEIVAAALFLADPDNGYMTGHTLTVDGGWTAGYARNF